MSTSKLGNISPIPFQCMMQSIHTQTSLADQDRLTHVQRMFTWNHSPRQSSKVPFEYLLLPPRSAAIVITPRFAPKIHYKLLHPPTHYIIELQTVVRYLLHAWAPSIFRAGPFGRWVVTHSLADFDFHDHRPAVHMNQHLLWCPMSGHCSSLS